jgi:malate dehydrogenase (oxaloacetate-decarboxylating)
MVRSHLQDQTLVSLYFSNNAGAEESIKQAIRPWRKDLAIYDVIETPTHILLLLSTSETIAQQIERSLQSLGMDLDVQILDPTFFLHRGGKIEIHPKCAVNGPETLGLAYTPEVAKICLAIHHHPEQAEAFTLKRNTIAVISDGTAVLGLGNIGPKAALPVMEGKALLFKEFANVDAFPLCLSTNNIEEFVQTVCHLAPNFGGINLEDISAPHCFEIERILKAKLDIPVFHDDQHGTAAVVGAAFINALKVTHKKASNLKIVFNGVGAAGTACKNMLIQLGAQNIIGCDRKGAIYRARTDLDASKKEFSETTNPDQEKGSLSDVIKNADVFIGLSGPNMLTVKDLQNMRKNPIVFAMANPIPEIMPEIANGYVAIMATGRSDYPNQINNLLAFPGIFRGALDCRARDINPEMCMAAALAIANVVTDEELKPTYIIPSVFDKKIVPAVAAAVIDAARKTNVARKKILTF